MTSVIEALKPTLWLKLDDANTADGATALNSGFGGYAGKPWKFRSPLGSLITQQGFGLVPHSSGSVLLQPALPITPTPSWITTCTDSFNRNGTSGVPSALGQKWVDAPAGLSITDSDQNVRLSFAALGESNSFLSDVEVRGPTAFRAFVPDQYAQIFVTALGTTVQGLLLRAGSIAVEWASNLTLRVVAPVVVDTGVTVAVADTIKVEVIGTTLTLYKNTGQVWTGVIPATAGGNPGLRMRYTGEVSGTSKFDTFEAGEYLQPGWVEVFADEFPSDGPLLGPVWEAIVGSTGGGIQGTATVVGGEVCFLGATGSSKNLYPHPKPSVHTFAPAQAAQCVFTGDGTGSTIPKLGVTVRDTGIDDPFANDFMVDFGHNAKYRVWRSVNSSHTLLFTSVANAVVGDVVRLEIIGLNLKLVVNGVTLYQAGLDLSIFSGTIETPGGGQPGIHLSGNLVTAAGALRLDHFKAYEMVPLALTPTPGASPYLDVAGGAQGCNMGGSTSEEFAPVIALVMKRPVIGDGENPTGFTLFNAMAATGWSLSREETGYPEIYLRGPSVFLTIDEFDYSIFDPVMVALKHWKMLGVHYFQIYFNGEKLGDAPLEYTEIVANEVTMNVNQIGFDFDMWAAGNGPVEPIDEVLYWKAGNTISDADIMAMYRSLIGSYDIFVAPIDDESYAVALVIPPPFEASCMSLDSLCWNTEFESPAFACPPLQSEAWPTCFESWSQPPLVSKMPCAVPVGGRPRIGGFTLLGATLEAAISFAPELSQAPPPHDFFTHWNTFRLMAYMGFVDTGPLNVLVTPNAGVAISTVQSKFGGKAFAFDGTLGFLTINDSSWAEVKAQEQTFDLWVYPTALSGNRTLIAKRTNGTSFSPLFLGLSNNTLQIRASITGSAWAAQNNAAGTLPLNQWTQLRFQRSRVRNQIELYMNRVLVGVAALSGIATLMDNTFPWRIGGDVSSNFFQGFMDDISSTMMVLSNADALPPAEPTLGYQPPITPALIPAGYGTPPPHTLNGKAQMSSVVEGYTTLILPNDTSYVSLDAPLVLPGDWTFETWGVHDGISREKLSYGPIFSLINGSEWFNFDTDTPVAAGSGEWDRLRVGQFIGSINSGFSSVALPIVKRKDQYHVALCYVRATGTVRIFHQGVKVAENTMPVISGVANWLAYIGRVPNPSVVGLSGFLGPWQFTNGVAKYNADFVPA